MAFRNGLRPDLCVPTPMQTAVRALVFITFHAAERTLDNLTPCIKPPENDVVFVLPEG